MKKIIEYMTNRELYTEWERGKKDERHFLILQEMTKRLGRKLIMGDTPALFKQYKLNGAGDQTY
mgnify:CR=1 FL=1